MAEFSFNYEEDYLHYVRAIKEPGYYRESYGVRLNPILEDRKTPGVIPVPLQPEGYIRFHLKNVKPVGPSDRISITGFKTFYGDEVDTVVCCDTRFGNEDITIYVGVKKHGETEASPLHQNLFLPAHDTTLVTIEY